ncbi:hypothetical protein [Neobacillus novalis]|uniref:hypothetical protein n=1 Tax=Neobacillus novalis TaxID=220687 RepID=UPI000A3DFB86|nr:hypothetical protein [Neobacillus novalis]
MAAEVATPILKPVISQIFLVLFLLDNGTSNSKASENAFNVYFIGIVKLGQYFY